MGIILEKRITAGMNRSELARAVGVAPASVAKWENGGFPKPKYVKKLAELFGMDTLELYKKLIEEGMK